MKYKIRKLITKLIGAKYTVGDTFEFKKEVQTVDMTVELIEEIFGDREVDITKEFSIDLVPDEKIKKSTNFQITRRYKTEDSFLYIVKSTDGNDISFSIDEKELDEKVLNE